MNNNWIRESIGTSRPKILVVFVKTSRRMCNAHIHDSQHRIGVDLTPPGFNITPLGVKKHIISLLGVTFFFLLYFNTNWCCSSKKSAPVRCETVFQSKVTPESYTKRLQLYTIGVKLPENFLQRRIPS